MSKLLPTSTKTLLIQFSIYSCFRSSITAKYSVYLTGEAKVLSPQNVEEDFVPVAESLSKPILPAKYQQ